MGQFLVGRQPIFDGNTDIYGYELLFRDPLGLSKDGDAKTADVLVHAGLDLGLDDLVGAKRAFVNATRSFIVGALSVGLPPEQTVIEVLEDVAHDEEVLEGCRRLVGQGYMLAVDDYVWAEGDAPLLELASIAKLDILAMSETELANQVELCSRFGVQLLAEKVETRQQLASCQELGFDLFQGYLLSRPSTAVGHSLAPSQITCLQVFDKLCDPKISAQEVASIIETDAALSYRFLRTAPIMAAGGIHRGLSSIREGIVLLGTRRLRDWVALMLLAETQGGAAEQLTIAMTRARMGELIAEARQPDLRDSAFTVGLVSALDLVLEVPLPEIVNNLAITDELVDALLEHTGPLGSILSEVLAWEVGGEGLVRPSEEDLAELEASYRLALAWSIDTCRVLEPIA